MNEEQCIQSAYAATSPEWKDAAWKLSLRFLKRVPNDRKFTTERLRRFCHAWGLEEVPGQCFGQLLRQLKAAKLIKAVGWRKTANPRCHSRRVRVWRAV